MKPRISFNNFDAERIYEWRLALKQGMDDSCCDNCDFIEKRLRDFLGKKEVRFLQRLVRIHPYFINGKRVKI
jgi:hypothetical protein